MSQKRVSFKVAKYLKKAGYPQCEADYHWFPIINFKTKGIKEWVYHKTQIPWLPTEYEKKIVIDAPTYLDVWTWLSDKKHIFIDVKHHCTNCVETYVETEICDKGLIFNEDNEEDGIAAAIDYLVNYNLIK